MSQTPTDTESIVPEPVVEDSSGSTKSEKGILVTEGELNELGALLETFKNILLGHEARHQSAEGRLAALEGNFETDEKPGLVVVGNFTGNDKTPDSVDEAQAAEMDEKSTSETTEA